MKLNLIAQQQKSFFLLDKNNFPIREIQTWKNYRYQVISSIGSGAGDLHYGWCRIEQSGVSVRLHNVRIILKSFATAVQRRQQPGIAQNVARKKLCGPAKLPLFLSSVVAPISVKPNGKLSETQIISEDVAQGNVNKYHLWLRHA